MSAVLKLKLLSAQYKKKAETMSQITARFSQQSNNISTGTVGHFLAYSASGSEMQEANAKHRNYSIYSRKHSEPKTYEKLYIKIVIRKKLRAK